MKAVRGFTARRFTVPALLATAVALIVPMASPAHAVLTAVSATVDPDTGYPDWYQDANGIKVKFCVDSDLCLGGDPRPDPTQPASVHTGNLPDEAFYAVARAEATLAGGGRIRWRAVLEGAFANEEVIDGDQIVFTRTQLRGDKIPLSRYPAGTVLTAKTPYGDLSAPVRSDGTLRRERLESDPGDASNGFTAPLTETQTGYGPTFMRWTSGAPAGFLGDPTVLHAATGGPKRNSFQVFRGSTSVSPLVTEFEIAGQCVQGTC